MKSYMLCRNKVRDYTVWRRVFGSHKAAHQEAGLILWKLWRAEDDPNNIYFVFEVQNRIKADAFVTAPGNDKIAQASGVLDGEIQYLEETDIY